MRTIYSFFLAILVFSLFTACSEFEVIPRINFQVNAQNNTVILTNFNIPDISQVSVELVLADGQNISFTTEYFADHIEIYSEEWVDGLAEEISVVAKSPNYQQDQFFLVKD